MSDPIVDTPRPVSLVTIFAILGCFALFLLVARYGYLPRQSAALSAIPAEKLPEDQAWRATHASKQAALAEHRAGEQKKATSYGWVDQKTGVVQLPLDRAMELVVRDYSAPARK